MSISWISRLHNKKAFLFTATLAGCLILWFGWCAISKRPIYDVGHSHDFQTSHEHAHTHGGLFSHGHEHFGLIGTVTHSHSHFHDHQHESESESVPPAGFTEIGHRHDGLATKSYWAKAETDGEQIWLKFCTNDGRLLKEVWPAESEFAVEILDGNQLVEKLMLARNGNHFVGKLTNCFFELPTHVLKISKLKFEGNRYSQVTIPLELQ